MNVAIPEPLVARWRALDAREQTLVRGAGVVLGLALVWWLFIGPPLATLRQAEAQQRSLDSQLQKMQSLRSQAQALQAQPKMTQDDALRALEASVKQRLGGSAQLNAVGDRATVILRNTPADALAQWLAQARVNARAVPSEARLTRSVTATPAVSTSAPPASASPTTATMAPASRLVTPQVNVAAGAVAWDGTLVLSLPSR